MSAGGIEGLGESGSGREKGLAALCRNKAQISVPPVSVNESIRQAALGRAEWIAPFVVPDPIQDRSLLLRGHFASEARLGQRSRIKSGTTLMAE